MSNRASYDNPHDYVYRGPLTDPRCAKEVSEFFIDGMRNRMAVSFYKYGPVADAYPHKVNALESMLVRIREYVTDERWEQLKAAMERIGQTPRKAPKPGNAEYLIDADNFGMIEFMFPSEPGAFFAGTDSDGSPGRIEACSGEAVHFENRDIFA